MGNLRRAKRSFGGAGTGWLIALLCPPPYSVWNPTATHSYCDNAI